MSSYGSTHSGYLHPSQYPPPQPHTQQQYPPQPPYPTTPGPPPTSQPQAFYPPTTQPQPTYSSSPSSNGGGGGGGQMLSSSPNAHHTMMPQDAPAHGSRRSSSLSASRPQMPYCQTAPIMIPSANTGHYATPHPQAQFQPPSSSYSPPVYARRPSHASHHSHHSSHMHDPHAWTHGEDKYGSGHHGPGNSGLDEETLREYERRYAKDRALEKRPTLGDSLMSAVGKMGRAFGSDRR